MQAVLNRKIIKAKAIDMSFAARTVLQQLAARDRTPEAFAAQKLLEEALTGAIPDAAEAEPELPLRKVAA